MAERKISEMSLEELKLYQQQLSEKITEVNFYLRQYASKGINHTNLEAQCISSQVNSKEEV